MEKGSWQRLSVLMSSCERGKDKLLEGYCGGSNIKVCAGGREMRRKEGSEGGREERTEGKGWVKRGREMMRGNE